jgi:hypothetical protein
MVATKVLSDRAIAIHSLFREMGAIVRVLSQFIWVHSSDPNAPEMCTMRASQQTERRGKLCGRAVHEVCEYL